MNAPVAPRQLALELLSDTAFGRGVGTAADVDIDVEQDGLGLPYLGGKTLHGLLRDAWLTMGHHFPDLQRAASRVLGPGGDHAETAILRVSDAAVDTATQDWVRWATQRALHPVPAREVLAALTDVRRQTAVARASGAPDAATLRATRVVLRGLTLYSSLTWLEPPGAGEVRCLALCALATRHAGLGRNRGRGHLRVTLDADVDATRRLALEAAS